MNPRLSTGSILKNACCGIAALAIAIGWLALAYDSKGFAGPKENETPAKNDAQVRNEHLELLTEHFTFPFEPSFEMRENVDFILTPALLVQENLSEHIVITYPNE